MPALPAVSKVVRVDFHHACGGNANVQVRAFFSYGGLLSQTDAQSWVNAIASAWVTNMLPPMTTNASLTSTLLTDLSSASAPQAISSTTGTGGQNVQPGALALAYIVKHKIARRYRGGHPRTYVPFPNPANMPTPNLWSAAAIAVYIGAFNAFISAALTGVPAAAAPATEVNVSYFSGFTNKTFPSGRTRPVPTPRVTPLVDTILSNSINPKPGEQRRRNQQSA